MCIFTKYDLIEVDETIRVPELPLEGLVVLYGSSGSGKSTILRNWFGEDKESFNLEKPLIELFKSEEEGEQFLIALGLRSVPCWRRPLGELSNGERHRAESALRLSGGVEYLDEFTSVVDRPTAHSLSVSLNRWFRESGLKRLVIASCHADILEWLEPDKVYNTDLCQWVDSRGLLRRPSIELRIKSVMPTEVWPIFRKHHYLSGSISKSCSAFVALYNGKAVAMTSVLPFPSGTIKNGWRGHRTVVLPEFQGLGIGNKLSECVAQYIVNSGCRFFSKTAHPAMGEHREKSPLWKATSKNRKKRLDYKVERKTKEDGHKMKHKHRLCYSHEYIGV